MNMSSGLGLIDGVSSSSALLSNKGSDDSGHDQKGRINGRSVSSTPITQGHLLLKLKDEGVVLDGMTHVESSHVGMGNFVHVKKTSVNDVEARYSENVDEFYDAKEIKSNEAGYFSIIFQKVIRIKDQMVSYLSGEASICIDTDSRDETDVSGRTGIELPSFLGTLAEFNEGDDINDYQSTQD